MTPLRPFACLLLLLTLAPPAYPCTWAIGYFHQVTTLRGTVVGVGDRDWRHLFRWTRQQVVQPNVKLTLYEYRWPVRSPSDRPVIRVIRTGKDGGFDFGSIAQGHYSLGIEDPWGGESWFDVEIVSQARPVERVLIDISHAGSDCQGGHEFLPATNRGRRPSGSLFAMVISATDPGVPSTATAPKTMYNIRGRSCHGDRLPRVSGRPIVRAS